MLKIGKKVNEAAFQQTLKAGVPVTQILNYQVYNYQSSFYLYTKMFVSKLIKWEISSSQSLK